MGTKLPVPSFFPVVNYTFNKYLAFSFNWPLLYAVSNLVYYIVLHRPGGLLYIPQMTLEFLTATAFAQRPNGKKIALFVHLFSWVAQFIGHGAFEKRAPALLDNILGAAVLAPFFVHLELLFKAGLFPGLHKRVQNKVGLEIARFRREEAEKKRQAEKKE